MSWRGANLNAVSCSPQVILGQINELKAAGCKLVRYPLVSDAAWMSQWSIDYYWQWLKYVLDCFDQVTPTLVANQMPTILDIHHTVGGFKNGKWQVFQSDAVLAEHVKAVAYVAERYKDNPAVFSITPFNEPQPKSNSQLRKAYDQCIAAARKAGFQKHIVVSHVGDVCDNMRDVVPPSDPTLWFEFHVYSPRDIVFQGVPGFNQPVGPVWKPSKSKMRDYLRQVIKFQDRYGRPMLAGEFGCSRMSGNGKNQGPWLTTAAEVFDEFDISHCVHTWSENAGDPWRPPLELLKSMWRGQ